MLTAAGADADYRSAGAEAAGHKTEGLLSTAGPAELRNLMDVDNLPLAETKEHWNW